MRLLTGRNIVLTLPLLAVVGLGAFAATRSIIQDQPSQADPQVPIATPVVREDISDEDRPRFTGELLGLYIAPEESLIPQEFRDKNAAIRAALPACEGSKREQSFEQVGELAISLTLPAEFTFDPQESHLVVCLGSEAVGSAHWEYKTKFNGFDGELRVVNSPGLPNYVTSVAEDRVSVITAGGRPAILIAPLSPESGYGSTADVIFVESDGVVRTSVSSNNVPLAQLLAAAELVGLALGPVE